MMRKLGTLLLALLLCFGAAHAEGSAEPKHFYFSDGETAYRLSDGGLWELDEALQPTGKLCDTEAVAGFADAEGIALAVPTEAGYRFERVGGEVLLEVENGRVLREFAVSGDCIVALWRYLSEERPEYSDGSEGLLTAYRLNGEEVYTPCYAAGAIALEADGSVLVAQYEPNGPKTIVRWDLASGMVRDVMDVDGATAMCASQGTIAYVYRGGVYAADDAGNSRLLGEAVQAADVGLFASGTRIAAYDRSGEPSMQIFDLAEASDKVTLTLVNCSDFNDDRMKKAIEMLREAHPDVDVRFVDMEAEPLNTALMANDEGLDLLYMNNFDAVNYVSAGVVEDLNDHPEVLAQLDGWIDLDGAMTWNGVRFGVPMDVNVNVLEFNEALAEFLPDGLDPNQLTWRALLDAGAQFSGDTDGDGRRDVWLWQDSRRFPAFLFQYIMSGDDLSALDFDTEAFRELMTLYRQCVQNGAFADYSDCDSSAAVFAASMKSALDTKTSLPLPEQEVPGAPLTTCTVMMLGVNRGSPNKALALELLADYCSAEAQKRVYTGSSEYAYFGFLRDLSAYEGYGQLSDSAKAAVEANRALFEQTKMSWNSREFNIYCGDQIEAYLDGEIELDELIQNLQQRKQMVLMG
ncbi:MAG: extracellular solute-binding protein [Clostridia bacterium]|nr:extracellular solute-binding protein [Clostridia bacterium]